MTIEPLSNNWDGANINRIDRNFKTLDERESKVISDILSREPATLSGTKNGIPKNKRDIINASTDFGINFTSKVNGVISYVSVYSPDNKKLAIGMAEQSVGTQSGAQIVFKEHDLVLGWNRVAINAPVEANKSYTIFKRNVGDDARVGAYRINGWNVYSFMEEHFTFRGGMYLHETGTYTQYAGFFDIEVITNLAQVYHLMSTSVKPPDQFHVGDTPPEDAKIWFRPVGG